MTATEMKLIAHIIVDACKLKQNIVNKLYKAIENISYNDIIESIKENIQNVSNMKSCFEQDIEEMESEIKISREFLEDEKRREEIFKNILEEFMASSSTG